MVYFVECQSVSTIIPDVVTASSTSSTSNIDQIFNLIIPWCAGGPVPQVITLKFNQSVYLTQLRVSGNSVNFDTLFHASRMHYETTAGFSVSLCISMYAWISITYLFIALRI